MLTCILELQDSLDEIKAVAAPLQRCQSAMDVVVFDRQNLDETVAVVSAIETLWTATRDWQVSHRFK